MSTKVLGSKRRYLSKTNQQTKQMLSLALESKVPTHMLWEDEELILLAVYLFVLWNMEKNEMTTTSLPCRFPCGFPVPPFATWTRTGPRVEKWQRLQVENKIEIHPTR